MNIMCPVCGNEMPSDATACPHCGFRPQGATQSFQPIPLAQEVQAEAAAAPRKRGRLSVVRGPQTGVAFELGDAALSIGRNPNCGIFLNDMTVSRQHAELEPCEGGWLIKDTNSFNGVWVNNKNVDSCILADGDVIQIGAFCLLYSTN